MSRDIVLIKPDQDERDLWESCALVPTYRGVGSEGVMNHTRKIKGFPETRKTSP